MKKLPKTCLVDTNVPVTANKALQPADINGELARCVSECVKAIEHVVNKSKLVIDEGGEIFGEYRHNLSLRGQPGVGDLFLKWIHDNQWRSDKVDRIHITKNAESYEEFPNHEGLIGFDRSDHKFIAVSNAHPEKPPILEATDTKWWHYKDILSEVGISVLFLCPEYINQTPVER